MSTLSIDHLNEVKTLEETSTAKLSQQQQQQQQQWQSYDLVLDDIVRACDAWTEKATLAESELIRSKDAGDTVAQSIQRQLWDGLLTVEEAHELGAVCEAWRKLRSGYLCRQLGAVYSDSEVIENLLELFAFGQISRAFVVRVILELCRQPKWR